VLLMMTRKMFKKKERKGRWKEDKEHTCNSNNVRLVGNCPKKASILDSFIFVAILFL
jgi:hypothetical protein